MSGYAANIENPYFSLDTLKTAVMTIHSLTPMIWTDAFQETIDFYTKVLGFICGDRNDEWGWAGLYHGHVDLMIAKPNAHTPFEKPGFTGSFYFKVDDVESVWSRVKDLVEVVYAPEEFDWKMREFGIRDNNGYLLQFGQDLLKQP
ncbi:MAG: VOC family protein [Saprospiraceae bacterium]|nr:VOC family protein [Saprospiraceae bacterium]